MNLKNHTKFDYFLTIKMCLSDYETHKMFFSVILGNHCSLRDKNTIFGKFTCPNHINHFAHPKTIIFFKIATTDFELFQFLYLISLTYIPLFTPVLCTTGGERFRFNKTDTFNAPTQTPTLIQLQYHHKTTKHTLKN